MKVTTVGIDLAKNLVQVHGVDERAAGPKFAPFSVVDSHLHCGTLMPYQKGATIPLTSVASGRVLPGHERPSTTSISTCSGSPPDRPLPTSRAALMSASMTAFGKR